MNEEKDFFSENDFTPLTEDAIKELDDTEVIPRSEFAEMASLADQVTQSAVTDQIKTPQEDLYDEIERLKTRLKHPMNDEEIDEYINTWSDKFIKYHQEVKRESPVVELLSLLLQWISPILTASAQAAIPAEKNVSQGLRRNFRPTLMDVQTIITAFYRGEIDAVKMRYNLASLGYEDNDIDTMLEVSRPIPTAQDIITFMVREVYTPEAVSKFRLHEGFSDLYPQAKEDAERIGITEDNLKKYWAGHWRLPGISQAYEMLHRQKIDGKTLELILRASDIMPGFIQPLIDISYTPITRVDIRRMNKLGLLTGEEVTKAYMDIGYNRDNAEKLRRFTESLNNDPDDESKNLSRTDIVKVYKMQLISRVDAKVWLKDLKYTDDNAELILDRADLEESIEIIELHIDTIKKQYINNLIDRKQVSDALDKVNLPSGYRDGLIERWTVDRDLKLKQPTKAEILGWYKNKTITREEAIAELSNIGYQIKYINWYLKSVPIEE